MHTIFPFVVLQLVIICFYGQYVNSAYFENSQIRTSVSLDHLTKTNTSVCPDSVDRSGLYLHADKRLCNVYHECNCTVVGSNTTCQLAKSNVCPTGLAFSNSTNKCELVEKVGCSTTYLQWADGQNLSKNNLLFEKDDVKTALEHDMSMNGHMPINDINYFMCPPGSNSRFADPYICNIFHVCVTRGDQTYDQPFLCPYSSVFRIIDSNTMYCDKKRETDCIGTAFYRGTDDETKVQMTSALLLNYTTNSAICTKKSGFVEDPLHCNTYHRCVNGIDEHYVCENQLLYNPLSTICDYPINVACGSKQIFKKTQGSNVVVETMPKLDAKSSASSGKSSANLIHNKFANPSSVSSSNSSVFVTIHGVKIGLNCPIGAKNALIPDAKYCNVFHHCHGGTGNVFICEKGQAFDGYANGPEKSGVCNFEDMVNCVGKYVLTEGGQRPGQPRKSNNQASDSGAPSANGAAPSAAAMAGSPNVAVSNSGASGTNSKSSMMSNNNFMMFPTQTVREETISGISFDCRGKANGHWRDSRYCDVFHACIGGEQRKTYSCAQLGERIYFDEMTKRCEFSKNNPMACMSNQYYQQVIIPNIQQGIMTDEPTEGWKQFVRSREQFTCGGKMDGFYASRWCNIFYRCFLGIKSEFLCPKMMTSDRLWWIQHGSPQETPQTSAACVWPCETKKQCSSPGGIVVEIGNGMYSESVTEADRVWKASSCTTDGASDIFKLPDQDFSCAGLPEGSFQPSKYCNVFHRCTNGKRKDFQCAKATNSPYDLWWNAATSQCDWPCKVACMKPVYGTAKSAQQIQMEDASLNEEECRGFKPSQQPVLTMMTQTPMIQIQSIAIPKPYPDDPYTCPGAGLFLSPKYCNVYYECTGAGQQPINAFYCKDGYFDNLTKQCRPAGAVQCPYVPPLLYPFGSILVPDAPEDVACATLGYYIIHSNRYCNLYYVCDGKSPQPQTYRCYDRQNLEDAVYNRETKKCESKSGSSCQGEILAVRQRYQSNPVDHTRIPELQPLTCRADQQYLAEHDRYCNLYHSCILGKYQMYVCVSIGGVDKTSYFYYTNGDCSAPNQAQCGPGKSVFPYDRLPLLDTWAKTGLGGRDNSFLPMVAPSIAYSGQSSYTSVTLKNMLDPLLECESTNNYLVPHKRYCNLFYECNSGKLKINACIDQSTNQFSGIFDKSTGKCKPFNSIDCPSNSIYNPEIELSRNNISEQAKAAHLRYDLNPTFFTDSSFSCLGRSNGYYESEWCNVFFRCLNGKRIDTKCGPGQKDGEFISYDLWWEHQNATYDPSRPRMFFGFDEEAKCEWPCKIKCNKPIWTPSNTKQSAEAIAALDTENHPECAHSAPKPASLIYHGAPLSMNSDYRAYETENSNPSGFFCDNDGTYRDPLFCNIYHVCINKQRRTFHCRQFETDGTGKSVSIYDSDRNACVSRDEGMQTCNGLIYDPNYMNLPAYRDLPVVPRSCDASGIFRANDGDFVYCDLFYWCEKPNTEPIFFHCNAAVFGKGIAFYNPESKQCESSQNVNCPYPNKLYSSIVSNNIAQSQSSINLPSQGIVNGLGQASPYIMQVVAGLMDPAPGYLSLPSNQFQTSFSCQNNPPGYYPNPEYCDLFHYCYPNGQYKTYVCASMQNRYQLWWSHQTEPGRRDNIFCDWPCNMLGPNTVCPANKRVLMRDRNQIPGGISQQEVVQSTCPNTGPILAPTTAMPGMGMNFPPMNMNPMPNPMPMPMPAQPTNPGGGVTGYPPCTKSMDWFISPPTIRCNSEYRKHGFSPDPRDCSKYYRCDQNVGLDGMSTGYLMSCIAGLWWDQSRRMCVSPSEVPCNPYNIINNQGAAPSYVYESSGSGSGSNEKANPNFSTQFGMGMGMGMGMGFGNGGFGTMDTSGLGSGAPCKQLTCAQAGLSMKLYMKSIPSRPGAFYKCDGQCAVEMMCPLDLIFDDANQRCEWPQSQMRMASLRAAENAILNTRSKKGNDTIVEDDERNKKCDCSNVNKNSNKLNNDEKKDDKRMKPESTNKVQMKP